MYAGSSLYGLRWVQFICSNGSLTYGDFIMLEIKVIDDTGECIESWFDSISELLNFIKDQFEIDKEENEVHTDKVEWEYEVDEFTYFIVKKLDDLTELEEYINSVGILGEHETYYDDDDDDDDDDVYETSELEYAAMEDALINRTDRNY